ncbi:MAG: hypothetical protein JWL84_828 [Rhodospirillales bacterium]|jgi:hypothetical protein|nr:hypothetical protein [Rhodospirillales bacterium]
MRAKELYAERAVRIRRTLEHLNDPLARIVLAALADALDEAAAEYLQLAGQKPSPDCDS